MSWFHEFHLGDNLQYRGWGVLKAMSLSEQEIRERQSRVVGILERYSGIILIEQPDWFWPDRVWADISGVRESNIGRVTRLLEENSSLIDALHYLSSDVTKNWKAISDITQSVAIFKMQIMRANSEEKIDIYNFVDVTIGEIIFDLSHDLKLWLWEPPEQEVRELEELRSARKRFLDFVNSPRAVMIWR